MLTRQVSFIFNLLSSQGCITGQLMRKFEQLHMRCYSLLDGVNHNTNGKANNVALEIITPITQMAKKPVLDSNAVLPIQAYGNGREDPLL